MKRDVNDRMREALRLWPDGQPIPFFCECADLDCYRLVWLRREQLDRGRARPGWGAVAPGHRPAGSRVAQPRS